MSEPFLAEIKMVGFNFAPRNWAFCDGQILPISQNQSLYSLIGTIYGGDGRTNFALPDLRGRTPIHFNSNHPQGSKAGEDAHSLSVSELPQHNHVVQGTSNTASETAPSNTRLSASNTSNPYSGSQTGAMGNMVGNTGSSSAHENMQPTLVLNFCIALQGLYPSRN